MASEIENAMKGIATVVGTVGSITVATSEPKEKPREGVFAMVFELSGETEIGAIGTDLSLDSFAIDVLMVRKDLPQQLATLNPYLDSIPTALIAQIKEGGGKFGNTISTFKRVKRLLLPSVEFANILHIGYRFIMEEVKILRTT